MVITIVCDVPLRATNGTTVAAMNLARSLREKGNEVRFLCCDGGQAEADGVFVCRKRSFGPFDGYVARVGVALAKPNEAVIRRALEGADVAHCMLPFALSKATLRIAHRMGIPVTAGFHCQAENFTNFVLLKNNRLANHLTYRYYYRKFYAAIDAVHYPSQFIRDVFEGETHRTNGRVISNGVGEEFFPHVAARPSEAEGKFVILSTGRYSREKCQSVLIEAVGKSKHRDDIRLVLAGQGTLDKKYRKLCEKYRLTDPTLRLFTHPELIAVLGYADLYVHPADVELEGIAVLEAVKSGLPIVVSDSARSATHALARDGRNLFRDGDANDLAARIDYWIEHEDERRACAEYYATCGKTAARSDCMDEMEEFLTDAVAEYRAAHAPVPALASEDRS